MNKYKYDYYIAGPMRGYFGNNAEIFRRVARTLESRGWRVFNPEKENGFEMPFAQCMTKDLNTIINDCEQIILLPGWRSSVGANTEVLVALCCGKTIKEIVLEYQDSNNLLEKDVTQELRVTLPFANKECNYKFMH